MCAKIIHCYYYCCIVIIDDCPDGSIRLIGGDTQYKGAVEVCINGVWSAVCPVGWDVNEANVVCRQLGYTTTGMMIIIIQLKLYFCFTLAVYNNNNNENNK